MPSAAAFTPDVDQATALDSSTPVARKRQRCDWCGEWVEKGERYERNKHVDSGLFGETKLHMECAAALKIYPYYDPDEGFTPHQYKRGLPEER